MPQHGRRKPTGTDARSTRSRTATSGRTSRLPTRRSSSHPRSRSDPQVRYPRDQILDPQLVWKGKDELDAEDLVTDAPPIYIQEKIDPRVLDREPPPNRGQARGRARAHSLRDVRRPRRARPRRLLPTRRQLVEPHDPRRLAQGDGVSLAEREALRGKVQMIYIDPPYGIKFGSNWQVSARHPKVADGSYRDTTREARGTSRPPDIERSSLRSHRSVLIE